MSQAPCRDRCGARQLNPRGDFLCPSRCGLCGSRVKGLDSEVDSKTPEGFLAGAQAVGAHLFSRGRIASSFPLTVSVTCAQWLVLQSRQQGQGPKPST